MDYIPSMSAVAAASQKPQHPETTVLPVAGHNVSTVDPASLDPRSIYTLSVEAAGAVLSLAQARVQATETAEFNTKYGHGPQFSRAVIATAVAATPVVSPETTKTVSAANRNWNEDVRLDHDPYRRVGTDTLVQYDNPRVMAAWSTAFPDILGRKFRGFLVSEANVKIALREIDESGFSGSSKDIYLLCNSEHFRIFSEDHPDIHINWISVDNDNILYFWPKNPVQE